MPASCPKCYQPNRDAAQFCASCGAPSILRKRNRVPRVAGSPAFVPRAGLLSGFNHPNIPCITGIFQHGSKHYTISELVEGDPVDQAVQRRKGGSRRRVRV